MNINWITFQMLRLLLSEAQKRGRTTTKLVNALCGVALLYLEFGIKLFVTFMLIVANY